MREIRPSGSEGGAGFIPRPYPYLQNFAPRGNERDDPQLQEIEMRGAFGGCAHTSCD